MIHLRGLWLVLRYRRRCRGPEKASDLAVLHSPCLSLTACVLQLHRPLCPLLDKAGARGQGSNTFGGEATMPPAPPGVECKKADFFPECEQWEKKDETGKSEEIKPQVFQILGGPWSSFVCSFVHSCTTHGLSAQCMYRHSSQQSRRHPWPGMAGRGGSP